MNFFENEKLPPNKRQNYKKKLRRDIMLPNLVANKHSAAAPDYKQLQK